MGVEVEAGCCATALNIKIANYGSEYSTSTIMWTRKPVACHVRSSLSQPLEKLANGLRDYRTNLLNVNLSSLDGTVVRKNMNTKRILVACKSLAI